MCLGNSRDNFQLHKFTTSENITKSFFFWGGATFLTRTVYYTGHVQVAALTITRLIRATTRRMTRTTNATSAPCLNRSWRPAPRPRRSSEVNTACGPPRLQVVVCVVTPAPLGRHAAPLAARPPENVSLLYSRFNHNK